MHLTKDTTTKPGHGETGSSGSPEQVRIFYGVGGERWLPEMTIPWLAGYENSAPVRIGSAAYGQLQIDVLGEVIDAMAQARKGGMEITERGRAIRPVVGNGLARAGPRNLGGPRRATTLYSFESHAWVAFDRAANQFSDEGSNESALRWRKIADEIHTEICQRGFDRELNAFVQAYGSKRLDASLLRCPSSAFFR
jgi:GH15 family glucan-1,4-alpha-glucosidase